MLSKPQLQGLLRREARVAGLDRVTPSQGMQESPPARIAGFSEMVCGSPTPREGGCREALRQRGLLKCHGYLRASQVALAVKKLPANAGAQQSD